jgi:uncharacterized protein VirK/YbjX
MRLLHDQIWAIKDALHAKRISLAEFCRENRINYDAFWFWSRGYSKGIRKQWQVKQFKEIVNKQLGVDIDKIETSTNKGEKQCGQLS